MTNHETIFLQCRSARPNLICWTFYWMYPTFKLL